MQCKKKNTRPEVQRRPRRTNPFSRSVSSPFLLLPRVAMGASLSLLLRSAKSRHPSRFPSFSHSKIRQSQPHKKNQKTSIHGDLMAHGSIFASLASMKIPPFSRLKVQPFFPLSLSGKSNHLSSPSPHLKTWGGREATMGCWRLPWESFLPLSLSPSPPPPPLKFKFVSCSTERLRLLDGKRGGGCIRLL